MHGVGVRLRFGGGPALSVGERPHLPARTAVSGAWYRHCHPLAQRVPSAAGAERPELLPLLLLEVGAVPLLRGEGGGEGPAAAERGESGMKQSRAFLTLQS